MESPLAKALRQGRRNAARAAERERLRQKDIELVRSGEADRMLREYGIDLLDHSPARASADGGAGHIMMGDLPPDPMKVSDFIRAVVNDPEREKERKRIKRAGKNDARNVPEDAPPPVSWPPQPWEVEL